MEQQQQQQQQQQQPPAPTLGRPWFRLGSMVRGDPTPALPQPQPQPALRPPLVRTQSVLPPMPAAPTTQIPPRPTSGTASLPPSPVLRPAIVGGTSSLPQSPRPPARTLFGGTASVPQSPLLTAAPRPTDGGTSSVPQSPRLAPSLAPKTSESGTLSLPQSPKTVPKQTNGGTTSLPQSLQAAKPAPAVSSPPSYPQPAKQTTGGISSVPQSPPPKATDSTAVQFPKTIKASPIPAAKSPPPSPKIIMKPSVTAIAGSPLKSPKTIKPSSPPPPLRLPSPQLKPDHPEPEPKRQLPKAETSSSPKSVVHLQEKQKLAPTKTEPYHRGFKSHTYSARNRSDDEQTGMRVITIAGENKGAIMELGRPSSTSTKNKQNNPAKEEDATKKDKDKTNPAAAPIRAFVNSNVQGVNNSILFNTSCTHGSPGVHLALSRQDFGGRKDPANGHRHHDQHS